MTLPRELLYDPNLRHIVQRPIEEFAQLRVLPPLARLRPQMVGAPIKLFKPRPEGHFVEVIAVFERPKTRVALWVDVLTPTGGSLFAAFRSHSSAHGSSTRWRRC